MTTELILLPRVDCRGREVTSARLRGLLALLAGELRGGCSGALLVDGLWPEEDEQPENPAKALQVLVSRARSQFGADIIATTPTGYRLALAEDQVDSSALLLRAAGAAQQAREGDHAASLAHAEAGLALWDGEGAADVLAGDPVAALRAQRAPARRALVRARALALARLGRYEEAAPALAEVAESGRRDEEALVELVRAEAATVGPPAALARYEAYRRSLREELGVDPGPALQALQRTLLQGEVPLVRHGLPHEPNQLLGREQDIAAVAALLRSSRVTSVVGPGGLGKTRLAQVVSRAAEQRVVHFVPLAGVTEDGAVAAEVAAALEAVDTPAAAGRPTRRASGPVTGIVEALGGGPVLLVLDNCEQVVGGVAELVQALVRASKDLRVLVTSRAPLGLSSESVYLLPELTPEVTEELFARRARAARPDVELPPAVVRELCRQLDGLPLAAELAAARVRVLSVPEIARRLSDRFALLRGSARDAPQRHRTLRAVVDWSWNLLEPESRRTMRALSVFPGGFTVESAQTLLDGLDPEQRDGPDGLDALELVEHLVDQSLLKAGGGADGSGGLRFHMLETVREFSAEEREAAGETADTTRAFLCWAQEFGLARHERAFGADPGAAAEAVRAEQENLLLAFRLGLAEGDGDTVAATAGVLAGLWTIEARYRRMQTLEAEAGPLLSHFRPGPRFVEVTRTAVTLSVVNIFLVHGPRPVRSLLVLLRLPEAEPTSLVRALATVVSVTQRMVAAGKGAEPLLALTRSERPLLAGVACGVASYAAEGQRDAVGALELARGMLAAFEQAAGLTPMTLILAHSRISELCLLAEEPEEAGRHLRAALLLQDRLGWPSDALGIRWALMLTSLQLGDADEAERWLEQAVLHHADEAVDALMLELGGRGEIALTRGETDLGLGLWRRAVDRLTTGALVDAALEQWVLEIKAVAVSAHAQHRRSHQVAELVGELEPALARMLADPQKVRSQAAMDRPLVGALLFALAGVDLDRGAAATGVRLFALAERFGFARNFQPTMSLPRARAAAGNADRPAYDEAVSSYAGLDPEGLRLAALAVWAERG